MSGAVGVVGIPWCAGTNRPSLEVDRTTCVVCGQPNVPTLREVDGVRVVSTHVDLLTGVRRARLLAESLESLCAQVARETNRARQGDDTAQVWGIVANMAETLVSSLVLAEKAMGR